MPTEIAGLYRLLAWLSPAFPTGGFSYSHGLEAAAADGAVRDRASLEVWIAAVVAKGSGRIDADLVCAAYRAAASDDAAALDAVNRRGVAYRATAELALESAAQGAAFVAAHEAAWLVDPPPPAAISRIAGEGAGGRSREAGEEQCHAVTFGTAAACAGIGLSNALVGYLQAFAANLMSAGLRLGMIGQSDGQRLLAALEPLVAAAAEAALVRDPADFGAATCALDLASMAHETQYTRLFRS
jgi:urease accessory protein